MAFVITPTQKKALEEAMYDLANTELEIETLQAAGVDVSDLVAIRADLKKNLSAYLEYAAKKVRMS